jgi:hypothetical protein
MSEPTIGIPNSPKFKIEGMVYAKSSHVAALSPVQCAVYLPEPTKVDLESMKGLLLTANPVYHERTKHIEIDCHTVREKIQKGEIKTSHVRTGEQVADLFTKPLRAPIFHTHLSKLSVIDIHTPT